jgi:hypothetical protein
MTDEILLLPKIARSSKIAEEADRTWTSLT